MTIQMDISLNSGNTRTECSSSSGKSPYFMEGYFTPSVNQKIVTSSSTSAATFDSMGYLINKRTKEKNLIPIKK